MIAEIEGRLSYKSFEYLIVNVNGVGYKIFVPLSIFSRLPELNETVRLKIHTVLKPETIELYGFLTEEELKTFQLLTGINGIGPRLARNILSGIPVQELLMAVSSGDVRRIKSIPGVGSKIAQRIIIELKEKTEKFLGSDQKGVKEENQKLKEEVISALVNLGYKKREAADAFEKIRKDGMPIEEIIKDCLRVISSKRV